MPSIKQPSPAEVQARRDQVAQELSSPKDLNDTFPIATRPRRQPLESFTLEAGPSRLVDRKPDLDAAVERILDAVSPALGTAETNNAIRPTELPTEGVNYQQPLRPYHREPLENLSREQLIQIIHFYMPKEPVPEAVIVPRRSEKQMTQLELEIEAGRRANRIHADNARLRPAIPPHPTDGTNVVVRQEGDRSLPLGINEGYTVNRSLQTLG